MAHENSGFDITIMFHKYRSTPSKLFCKNDVIKNFKNLQESACIRVLFWKNQATQAETPRQVFSWEFCKIFKKTYFEELLRTAVYYSVLWKWTASTKGIRKDNSWSFCQLWYCCTSEYLCFPAPLRFHAICADQSTSKFCAIKP